jgi:hypothetical protein
MVLSDSCGREDRVGSTANLHVVIRLASVG